VTFNPLKHIDLFGTILLPSRCPSTPVCSSRPGAT
jgi:hypothetical protein